MTTPMTDAERAAWLGYPSVAAMQAEHDALHRRLAGVMGVHRDSPTLRWVERGELAHPTRHDDALGWEEDLVFDVARWLNTGRWGGTMRVLWWLGLEPDEVRRRLR